MDKKEYELMTMKISRELTNRIGFAKVIGFNLSKDLTLNDIVLRKNNKLYSIIPKGIFTKRLAIKFRSTIKTSLKQDMESIISAYRNIAVAELVFSHLQGEYKTRIYRTLFGIVILQENNKSSEIQEIWLTEGEITDALFKKCDIKEKSIKIDNIYKDKELRRELFG